MKARTAVATLAALLILAAPAAFAKDGGALSLVPKNAVTVGLVKVGELRSSPLASTLFDHANKMGANGKADEFIRETGLDPAKDIDLLVVATAPRTTLGTEVDGLVIAEGRFNVERLSKTLVTHGATKKGAYFLLDDASNSKNTAAVAFLSPSMVVGGTEKAVVDALAAKAAGGTGFVQASALGRDLARIDANASAWVLIDVPRVSRLDGAPNVPNGKEQSTQALAAAIKSVATIGLWGTDTGDALRVGGFGVSSDSETLQLLEDTVRGALSAMRLAVKDKAPEMVSLLRRFEVSQTKDTVTVTGTIPAETLRQLKASKATKTASR
jgi:hypothetical protein